MSKFYKARLKDFFNHKLIYDKSIPAEKREGLDGIYIASENISIAPTAVSGGVEFDFDFGPYDNIMCESQRIPVRAEVGKLHIIGFSYWGNTDEYFQAEYDDGCCEWLKVHFADWAHKNTIGWDSDSGPDNEKIAYSAISSGEMLHFIYFRHITVELNGNKTLKELVLPNNFWIHIFAMTFEEYKK